MKQFEFSTLRIFVTVVRHGSLSAAAEQLHLAVTAISKRMIDLETQVGAKLLRRQGRSGVVPTTAGQMLLHHAQELLFGVERMRTELREFSHSVKDQVRIAAIASAVTHYLPSELQQFSKVNPQVRIDLRELVAYQCAEALRDGLVDVGIVVPETDTSGLQTFNYRTDRLCLLVSSGHPAARLKSISFDQALNWDFIGPIATSHMMMMLGQHADGFMRLRMQVMSFGAMGEMVQAGFGVGVLPEHAARVQAKLRGLKIVPLADAWAVHRMQVAVRSTQTLSAPARQLLHLLAPQAAVASSPTD